MLIDELIKKLEAFKNLGLEGMSEGTDIIVIAEARGYYNLSTKLLEFIKAQKEEKGATGDRE